MHGGPDHEPGHARRLVRGHHEARPPSRQEQQETFARVLVLLCDHPEVDVPNLPVAVTAG